MYKTFEKILKNIKMKKSVFFKVCLNTRHIVFQQPLILHLLDKLNPILGLVKVGANLPKRV